jgi:hypothetical protein
VVATFAKGRITLDEFEEEFRSLPPAFRRPTRASREDIIRGLVTRRMLALAARTEGLGPPGYSPLDERMQVRALLAARGLRPARDIREAGQSWIRFREIVRAALGGEEAEVFIDPLALRRAEVDESAAPEFATDARSQAPPEMFYLEEEGAVRSCQGTIESRSGHYWAHCGSNDPTLVLSSDDIIYLEALYGPVEGFIHRFELRLDPQPKPAARAVQASGPAAERTEDARPWPEWLRTLLAFLGLGALIGFAAYADLRRRRKWIGIAGQIGFTCDLRRLHRQVRELPKVGIQRGMLTDVKAILRGRIDGCEAFIVPCTTGVTRSTSQWHTVACLHLPGRALPTFDLRPSDAAPPASPFAPLPFTFPDDPAFSRACRLLGSDADALRALFGPDVRSFLADPANAGWYVEGKDDWLVLRPQEAVADWKLDGFVRDVARIAAVFRVPRTETTEPGRA